MVEIAGREKVLAVLSDVVPSHTRWAFRGGLDAIDRWLAADKLQDLDLWVHTDDLTAFCSVLAPHVKGVISLELDPGWLRHVVLVMSDACGNQLLDISFGDLKVGGALTCPEEMVSVVPRIHGPVLDGVSVVADLLLRKLMRGKLPGKDLMGEARSAWQNASAEAQLRWREVMAATLSVRLADRIVQLCEGAKPKRSDRSVFILATLNATRRSAGMSIILRRRRRLVLGRQARTLYKRPMAPVLLAVSDEEAAGKAADMLNALGVRCLVLAGPLTGIRQVFQAGVLGQTVIATPEEIDNLPTIVTRVFGAPLEFDPTQPESALSDYLSKAHRWYIDNFDNARRLSAHSAAARHC